MNPEVIATAAGVLFAPADRPERFAKAAAAGADLVLLDLEDAVAPEAKDQARAAADAWFATGAIAEIRINPPGTPWFDADAELARKHACPVMVPKAEDAALLAGLALPGPIIALVETALGIEQAREVCAVPGVVRAAFGSVDLATELGIAADDQLALTHARSRLVLASAAARIAPPLDGVTVHLRDPATLDSDIRHARRLGFTGKLCIHPKQLGPTRQGFSPSAEELEWAHQVLAAGSTGVSAVDGKMVDRPVLERARRLLRRETTESGPQAQYESLPGSVKEQS